MIHHNQTGLTRDCNTLSSSRRLSAEGLLDAGTVYQAARRYSALLNTIDGEEDRRRAMRIVNRVRNNHQRKQARALRSQNKGMREELDIYKRALASTKHELLQLRQQVREEIVCHNVDTVTADAYFTNDNIDYNSARLKKEISFVLRASKRRSDWNPHKATWWRLN